MSSNPQTVSNVSNAFTINSSVIPQTSIFSNKTEICSNEQVMFTTTIQNGGNAPTYQWLINGINAGNNSAGFIASNLNNGDVISLQLTSNANCTYPQTVVSNPISITVNSMITPSVDIYSASNTICLGDNIDFMAVASNTGSQPSYMWKVNNIDQQVNSPFFSSNTLNNNDIVSCLLISNATCSTSSNAVSVISMQVVEPPVADFSYSANGKAFNFYDNSQNALYYWWNFGDGVTHDAQNPTHTYTADGTYTVSYTASNNGCSDVAEQTIQVATSIETESGNFIHLYPIPTSDFLTIDCNGLNLKLLQIYDLSGKLVVERFDITDKATLNVGNLAKGSYFVKIQADKNYHAIFVKQ